MKPLPSNNNVPKSHCKKPLIALEARAYNYDPPDLTDHKNRSGGKTTR